MGFSFPIHGPKQYISPQILKKKNLDNLSYYNISVSAKLANLKLLVPLYSWPMKETNSRENIHDEKWLHV